MYINKTVCLDCKGSGKRLNWVTSEINPDGTGTIKMEESVCDTCQGKGYTEYPVFTVEEAIKIAEHLGFEIIREGE